MDHLLDRECCVYAQIPYRIRDYDSIRRDPDHTIDFDQELEDEIADRVAKLGADGKLLRNSQDQLCRATLGEKLLVPMLAKMTNFVPDGGIWLNTQRPEWNDANNAIVGNGLSMVTVCYLRRYFAFMIDWFAGKDLPKTIRVASEVAELFEQVVASIRPYVDLVEEQVVERQRRWQAASRSGRCLGDRRFPVSRESVSQRFVRRQSSAVD